MTVSVGESRLDERCWQTWSDAEQSSKGSLREGIGELTKLTHDAVILDDWPAVQDLRRVFVSGRTYCCEEPLLSVYEFGMASILTAIGNWHGSGERYAQAHQEIAEALQVMQDGDERRERMGLPAQTNYLPRLGSYLTLGMIKWYGPEEHRDVILAPSELLRETTRIADAVSQVLREGSLPASVNARVVRDGLALTELDACKVALRYCPDQIPDVIYGFNQRHGLHLTPEVGHFRCQLLPEGSAYYWDFELAKLYLAGQHTPEEVHLCMELRAASARTTFGDWHLGGLYRHWRKQALAILHDAGARTAS